MNTDVSDQHPDHGAPRPGDARTAADVERLAEVLYGSRPSHLGRHWGTGVLHPTSVWRGAQGDADKPMTLRIGDQTPKSEWDDLALGLARARADAIITSGRILRTEPNLRHDMPGPGSLPTALAEWRRERGKSKPPLSLIMSLSGEIDLEHPLFGGPGRVLVYTSERGAWHLDSRAADAAVEVQAVAEPTAQGAIDFARAAFGCATISIEAGPSISRRLYDEPAAIDEVLLSTYLGTELPTAARGGRQISRTWLDYRYERVSTSTQPAPGAPNAWRFERFLKR